MIKQNIHCGELLAHGWTDVPEQGQLIPNLPFCGHADNGLGAAESRHLPCHIPAEGTHHYGADLRINGQGAGAVAHGIVVVIQVEIRVPEPFFVVNIRLRPDGNAAHSLNSFHWILPCGGLTGEHNGAGAIVDGVGHVGDLCSGGTGLGGHGLQHFRSGDDDLAPLQAELDELLLDGGQLLIGDLHAQVSASDHDAITVVQNGIGIVHAGTVFNFGDDVGVYFYSGDSQIYLCP